MFKSDYLVELTILLVTTKCLLFSVINIGNRSCLCISTVMYGLGFILSFVTNTVINVITWICSLFKNFDIGSILSDYSRIYRVFNEVSLVAINLNDFDGFEINYTINNYIIVLLRSIKLPIRFFYIC